MPLYFFTLRDDHVHDPEPTELASLEAAKTMAVKFVGDLLADHPASFWNERRLTLQVADETRSPLFEISVVASEAPPNVVTVTLAT